LDSTSVNRVVSCMRSWGSPKNPEKNVQTTNTHSLLNLTASVCISLLPG
jgi:hypothetical protein